MVSQNTVTTQWLCSGSQQRICKRRTSWRDCDSMCSVYCKEILRFCSPSLCQDANYCKAYPSAHSIPNSFFSQSGFSSVARIKISPSHLLVMSSAWDCEQGSPPIDSSTQALMAKPRHKSVTLQASNPPGRNVDIPRRPSCLFLCLSVY